jgi:hypothetical protein
MAVPAAEGAAVVCGRVPWAPTPRPIRRCQRGSPGPSVAATAAALAEGLDPVIHHLLVVEPLRRQAATQLDRALVEQAAEPQCCCLLRPGEVVLPGQQPVDLRLGDHPGAEGFEEQLADGHGGCNEVVTFCAPWPGSASRLGFVEGGNGWRERLVSLAPPRLRRRFTFRYASCQDEKNHSRP